MHFIELQVDSASSDPLSKDNEREKLLSEDDSETLNTANKGQLLVKNNPVINASSYSDFTLSAPPSPLMNKDLIAEVEKKDRSHWQFDRLLPIWLILFCLIMQSMIKDSDIFGVSNCSAVYWLVYAVYIIICIIVATYTVKQLSKVSYYR